MHAWNYLIATKSWNGIAFFGWMYTFWMNIWVYIHLSMNENRCIHWSSTLPKINEVKNNSFQIQDILILHQDISNYRKRRFLVPPTVLCLQNQPPYQIDELIFSVPQELDYCMTIGMQFSIVGRWVPPKLPFVTVPSNYY